MPQVTGELILKASLPMGYIREKSLIMVTKGVRVLVKIVVSTDWLLLKQGIVHQYIWS